MPGPPYPTDRDSLERDTRMSFLRAGGPGGQHRNTTETGVRLFHPASGVTVSATERRSQTQNRELAFQRLAERLKKLNHVPKKRRATRPTRGSVQRRLSGKKQRGETKRQRGSLDD